MRKILSVLEERFPVLFEAMRVSAKDRQGSSTNEEGVNETNQPKL